MQGVKLQQKYKILRVLSRDSLTETCLAWGKGSNRSQRYVIKRFRPILGNPEVEAAKQLFDREADILTMLRGKHRQIPQICDRFTEGGESYLVREWIEGSTLEQTVKQRGKLSETEVTPILKSILSVIQYLRELNLVYREINPRTIVLRQPSWYERTIGKEPHYLPVLIDLSQIETMTAPESQILPADLSQPNLVLASSTYYASFASKQGKLESARDLYSLGLTAVYLLVGKTPEQLSLSPNSKKLLWHQESRGLTSNLVRAIDRAISPYLDERFTSADEMLKALFPRSVVISASLITDAKPQSRLTPEVKIFLALSCLGLGIIGIAFALLDLDFERIEIPGSSVSSVSEVAESDRLSR
ncbi:MAG: protein kinase [Cyanobacteria bacterium P01_G01_bin.19]